jgi:hypothetical protein
VQDLADNQRGKEMGMKRPLALLVVVAMAAVFGTATLAGADCAYHKAQAAVDKADPTKSVATAPVTDKTDADQLKTVQVTKPAQTKAEVKN